MWHPSFAELMVIMVIALLLFGKRLPDVARSLGKGVVEFKKGLKGVEDEVSQAEYEGMQRSSRPAANNGEKAVSTSNQQEGSAP